MTALFYVAALVMIIVFYREPRVRQAREAGRSLRSVFSELAGTHGFLLTLAVIFTLQTVDRSFSPILPLFVEQLGVETGRVATVSGLLFSLIAVCAALGHRTATRFMARWSPKAIMTTVVGDHGCGDARDRPAAVDDDADGGDYRGELRHRRGDDGGVQRRGCTAAG